MNVQLYNKTTKLIFIAILVWCIVGILDPLVDLVGGVNSAASYAGGGSAGVKIFTILFGIISLAASCLFAWGLLNLKGIVDGPETQGAVNIVFVAAAIAAVQAILGFFSVSILDNLVGLAVAIVFLVGYNKMKVAPTLPEVAKQGANLLFVGAILQLIAAVFRFIPFLGGVIAFLIYIAVFILYIIGWKKISTPAA